MGQESGHDLAEYLLTHMIAVKLWAETMVPSEGSPSERIHFQAHHVVVVRPLSLA